MCFGLRQMADKSQNSFSGPTLAGGTRPDPIGGQTHLNTHPGASSGTKGLGLPHFPALCGSQGEQQKGLDRNFFFLWAQHKGRETIRRCRRKKRDSRFSLKLPSY